MISVHMVTSPRLWLGRSPLSFPLPSNMGLTKDNLAFQRYLGFSYNPWKVIENSAIFIYILSLSVYMAFSVYVSLCISISVCVSVSLSLCFCLSLSLCLSDAH